MTDQITQSKTVRLARNEFEGAAEALTFYMASYMSTPGVRGQGAIQAYIRLAAPDAFLWLHMWFGKNHQRIQAGDEVRLWSPGDEPEFVKAEVLDVTTFAAFLLHENGAEWTAWPMVHRLDRLHTQPDFDTSHWVPVAQHMGYDVKPEDAAEYESTRKRLTLVRDDKSGGAS